MSDQQTLDSSPPTHSDDLPHSNSASDPSLLRSLSSSRLNAGAPEFVPGRTTPPPLPQPPRMIIPPPPPHGMLHMYHHQRPFNVPVLGPVPIQPHHHPHHRFHHNRPQYVPVRNPHGGHLQQRGEQEADSLVVKKSSDRRDHKRESKNDQTTEAGASVVIDPKTGLPEDTVQKIVNQVEYYFSDLNLATTDHLMRFISKDPEGYVPIHVVASFKKVKAVVSGNSQLATVLQNSAKLVVSEDGKKVRRINPVTEAALEELQSRIVLAENLPEDHCYQNLMKIFSTVGSVKNIRTCQPQITGNAVPPAARSAKSDGSLFSNKVHAFVEYETVELAEKAVAELNEAGNWRSSLKVRLMLKPQQTKEPKQGQGRGRKGHDVEVEHEEDDATTSEQQPIEKQSEECPGGEWDTHVPEPAVIVGEEEQGNEKAAVQRKGRSRGRGKGRGRGQPHQNQNQNQNHNGRGNHHNHHHQHHHQVGTPPSNNNQMNSMEQQPKQQPPGPRMPDGTRGFSMGRGKPITVQAD
ncbi:La-related protein 6B [Hirschfeldia incana]|nr:La-related protein 6B [Hirschfeldia incana]